jgi:hypothetical protein
MMPRIALDIDDATLFEVQVALRSRIAILQGLAEKARKPDRHALSLRLQKVADALEVIVRQTYRVEA